MICLLIRIIDVWNADSRVLIFTLKNPHGVEPTQFMKKEECEFAIRCDSECGPVFGIFDIYISDYCNRENSCSIDIDGTNGYECHPIHKKSLFVNTAEPDVKNLFTVLDYEVFTHN